LSDVHNAVEHAIDKVNLH